MNNNINELDTIIELTDAVVNQSPLMSQNAIHDEAIFDSLKTLKTTNGASFMPPYADAPMTPKHDVPKEEQASPSSEVGIQTALDNDSIIELDNDAVVRPQYTVTTELFSTPLEFGEQKKQAEKIEKIESVHIDTVHINTICASKTLCDSLHLEAEQHEVQDEVATAKPIHEVKSEECGDIKESFVSYDGMKEILRDVSVLQETVAKMQLRVSAQEACIASLASRLMAAEAKNRELVERCSQIQAPQFDVAQLEKMTAGVAARVVREEIQALLESVEQ